MKKTICSTLTIIMCLSFVGCNNVSEEDYNRLQLQLQEQEALVSTLQSQLIDKEKEITEFENEIVKKENYISDYKETISSQNDKIDTLLQEVKDYTENINTLQSTVDNYESLKGQLLEYFSNSKTEEEWIKEQKRIPNKIPETPKGDPLYQWGKYRSTYFYVWDILMYLKQIRDEKMVYSVDGISASEFDATYMEPILNEDALWNGKYFDECPKLTVIKKFRITREEMEQIVELMRHGESDNDEILNIDILYTFDNDIINEYYLFK